MSTLQSKNLKKKTYDTIVIGSDLEGLLIACHLSKQGQDVALIDSKDQTGGVTKSYHWNFLPLQDQTLDYLHWLENQLGEEIVEETQDVPPQTLEKSQLRTFVGFGKTDPPLFYDELKPYLGAQRITIKVPPQDWIEKLTHQFQGDFCPNSHITEIEINEGQVQGLNVNGNSFFTAKQYISCLPLKKLTQIVSHDSINSRTVQKITKTRSWGAIYWDLKHSEPICEEQNLFFMPVIEKNEETGGVIGQFTTPTSSQWMTFYPPSEGPEVAGHFVKRIKKQVKRLFPEALETIESDKLLATDELFSFVDVKLEENQTFRGIPNLFIATPQVSPSRGLEGALERAQTLINQFAPQGFTHPPSTHPDSQASL